tara:strand:+ start:3944 stop:4549 length:606 start_codon:yes stop_codon:yes gene_type:complete
MSKNEEKELAKELARCLYEIKNKKKKVEDKGEPFFSDKAESLFSEAPERPPRLRKGGRKKKTMKKRNIKKTRRTNKKTKNKTNKNIVSNKNQICKKKYCKNIFLPEREKVEKEFSKNYKTIEELRKTGDKFDIRIANILEKNYLQTCHDIYCQNKCKTKSQKPWVKSITKKRKTKLMEKGATSGCRDLIKEFPKYYKNKEV